MMLVFDEAEAALGDRRCAGVPPEAYVWALLVRDRPRSPRFYESWQP